MSEEIEGHIPAFDDAPLPSADGTYPPRPSQKQIAERAAKGQSRKTGEYLWGPMPAAMLLSDAWRGLTPAAVNVVLRIFAEWAGQPVNRRRNGEIVVSFGDFERHGIRRKSLPAAIKRAVDLGFIVAKRGHRVGAGGKYTTSTYGLTFVPWADADHAEHRWASEECTALGRQLAAEQTLKHRKNPIGEANLNVVRLERARCKLARRP
jgi:hypothetical protein